MDNTNAILTFKYSFSIEKEDCGFNRIRKDLIKSLVENEKYYVYRKNENIYEDNVIYSVINDLFQRRFSFAGNINAYLTNYSEKKGSLVISFSVLVVGAITNYGAIRETIEYFAEDIEKLFDKSLNQLNNEGGYKVIPEFRELNKRRQQTRTSDPNQYDILLKKIRLNRIFIGIVSFVLILFLMLYFGNVSFQNADSTSTQKGDKINELIIRKIVEDEMRNKRVDDLLNNVPTNKTEKDN